MKRQRKRLCPKRVILGKKKCKYSHIKNHSSSIIHTPKNTSQYLIKQFSKKRKHFNFTSSKDDEILCGSMLMLDHNDSCFDLRESISDLSTCLD